jgi:hypothetical protein
MIVGIVKGGLGNQLFQYAATRTLAKYHQVPFQLNIAAFSASDHRSFRLDDLLTLDQTWITKNALPKNTFANRIFDHLKPWYKRFYIKEREGHSKDYFFKFPAQCIIDGYWQQLTFIKLTDMKVELSAAQHHPAHQVAVHFRGGDYMDNPDTADYHGNLNEAYYKKAFATMLAKFPHVEFFLFSDQPERFKYTFLKEYNVNWIDEKDEVKAFRKLLHFQSFIIANSSFSWWPAFINDDKEGLIIAPNKWFQVKALQNYSPVLSHWLRL